MEIEGKKTFSAYNEDRANIIMLKTELHIYQYMQQLEKIYDNMMKTNVWEGIMVELLSKLDDSSKNDEIYPKFWKSVVHVEAGKDEFGNAILKIAIPIYGHEKFHLFHVLAIPNTETNTIPKVEKNKIAYNEQKQLFMYNPKLMQLKHELSVCNEDSYELIKMDTSKDCIIKQLANPGIESCEMDPIPTEFTLWKKLPPHNKFFFYSNDRNTLVCPLKRDEIAEKIGTIVIPPGCYIETPEKIIRGTNDVAKTLKTQFKVYHIKLQNEDEIVANDSSQVKFNEINGTKIDLTGLDEVKKEAEESFYDNLFGTISSFVRSVFTWIAFAAIIVVAVASWFLYRKCRSEIANRENQSHTDPRRRALPRTPNESSMTHQEYIEMKTITDPLTLSDRPRVLSVGEDVRSHK